MSKKKLLSESQVRRFMGLAGLSPINENYMDENMYEAEEEMAEEEPMPEEEPEKEAGDVDAEVDEDKLMKGLQGLKDGLEVLEDIASAAGLEAGEEMDAEEPEMDAEEPEMDAEEPAEDEDMDAELEDVDMEATEEEEQEMQEQIVNEVARRVAKRIVEAKRAHRKMNEALGRKK